jgi:hypothetical protein
VPVKKEMNRFVPFTVELLESVAIPPVLVKLAMVKHTEFCEKVTHVFKNQIKT